STVKFPAASDWFVPPIFKTWPVNDPLPAVKVPPAATVRSLFTVKVLAGVDMYSSIPLAPCPTVRLRQVAVGTSIVTVAPSAIVTLSVAVGTTPPTQVAVELQFPPAPVEMMLPGALVALLPAAGLALRAPSVTANTFQK